MKIDKKLFEKIFQGKFWQKLNESLVPFDDKPINKEDFLNSLFDEIKNYTYQPSPPREYIVYNKHNGVSRYVATFNRKDYCVYYLCIKLLEEHIAFNRVGGTFGGWTLGNKIRLKEEQELLELEYLPANTLNELAWVKEWRNFQGIAIQYSRTDDYQYFINIDIANFYDSINLSLLERNIRHVVPKNKQQIVTLLFHFLHNWNKQIEGYGSKSVGIPQDEIGDCSRILANFYLQEYDEVIKEVCNELNARYIRFADDQVFYTNNKADARKILFLASKELFRLNLNINSSKVKEFQGRAQFDQYWAFDIFDHLKDLNNIEGVNTAVGMYFTNIDQGIKFRQASVLKRILSANFTQINPRERHRLLSDFFDIDFLQSLNIWHFRRIRAAVANDTDFFKLLDDNISSTYFNSFLYSLMSFYEKDRPDFDRSIIHDAILKLKNL